MKLIGIACISLVYMSTFSIRDSGAETYQYIDENGTLSFTDNHVTIPKNARSSKSLGDNDSEDGSVTSFRLINNHAIVSVVLLYKGREARGQFVFDTGANTSVISPDIARRLEVDYKDTSRAMIRGVGGTSSTSTVVLDAIKLDGKSVGNVNVCVVEFGNFDGLLGMDFLAGKKFQIDYHAHKIRWQ